MAVVLVRVLSSIIALSVALNCSGVSNQGIPGLQKSAFDPNDPNVITIRSDYEAVESVERVTAQCRSGQPDTTIGIAQSRIGYGAPTIQLPLRWLGKRVVSDDVGRINSNLKFFSAVTDIRVRCGPSIESGQGSFRITGFPNSAARARFGRNEVTVIIIFEDGRLSRVSAMNLPEDFLVDSKPLPH